MIRLTAIAMSFFPFWHINYLKASSSFHTHVAYFSQTSHPGQGSLQCSMQNCKWRPHHSLQNNSLGNAVRLVSSGALNPPRVACYTRIDTIVAAIYHHDILWKLLNKTSNSCALWSKLLRLEIHTCALPQNKKAYGNDNVAKQKQQSLQIMWWSVLQNNT